MPAWKDLGVSGKGLFFVFFMLLFFCAPLARTRRGPESPACELVCRCTFKDKEAHMSPLQAARRVPASSVMHEVTMDEQIGVLCCELALTRACLRILWRMQR